MISRSQISSTTANGALPGGHNFIITVPGGYSGSVSDVTVLFLAPNVVPRANAGPDQDGVESGETNMLDASASLDCDGSIASYA